MSATDLFQLAGQFGPMGLLIAYLVWRETNDRKDRKDETQSRLTLATTLEALRAAITGRASV